MISEIIISRFLLKFPLKTACSPSRVPYFPLSSSCPWTIVSASLGPSDGLGLFARAPLDDVTVSIGSVGPLFFPCWQFRQRYACTEPVSSKPPPHISLSFSLSLKMRFLSILRFPRRTSGSSGRGFRRAERRSIRRSRTEKERSRLTLLGDFVAEGGGWRHEGGEGRSRENGAFPGDSSEKRRAQAWLRADMPGYEREKMMRRRVAPAFYPLPFACDPVDRDSKPRLHDFHRAETTSGLYPLVIMLCTSVNWIQLSRNSLASLFHAFHLLQPFSYSCFLSFRIC